MTEPARSPGAIAPGGSAATQGDPAATPRGSAAAGAVPSWLAAVLRPIYGFRLSYLPLIMVYFAYGALGLIDVTRDMWIKEQLRLSPAELAAIGVWLSLPWTVKMVFGELVDSVPIFGSQRRSYILIGAALTAGGMLTLAGAAGGMLVAHAARAGLFARRPADRDRDADPGRGRRRDVDRGRARVDDAGNARPEQDIRAELGMVQVLGRLALSFGILAVAGVSGGLQASSIARRCFCWG